MEPDVMDLWKTIFLYKPVGVRFHVIFPGWTDLGRPETTEVGPTAEMKRRHRIWSRRRPVWGPKRRDPQSETLVIKLVTINVLGSGGAFGLGLGDSEIHVLESGGPTSRKPQASPSHKDLETTSTLEMISDAQVLEPPHRSSDAQGASPSSVNHRWLLDAGGAVGAHGKHHFAWELGNQVLSFSSHHEAMVSFSVSLSRRLRLPAPCTCLKVGSMTFSHQQSSGGLFRQGAFVVSGPCRTEKRGGAKQVKLDLFLESSPSANRRDDWRDGLSGAVTSLSQLIQNH